MINEKPLFKGLVHLQRWDEAGKLVDEYYDHNLVVTTGLEWVISRMAGTADAVMSYMGVGSVGTTTVAGDTALGAEISRVAFTSATPVGAIMTYIATFSPGVGTGSVLEAGLFNSASAGTMLARVVFPVINKGAGDTLTISWTIEATV